MYKFILLRDILSGEHLKSTYHALVESHLNYGITAWGSAHENQLKNLNVSHKRILKIIYRKPPRFPTEELFQIAKVHNIRELFIKACVYDTFKNKTFNTTVSHTYPTRWRQNLTLRQDLVRTAYMQRQCEFIGIKYYNKLPAEIKNSHNDKLFKKKVAKWIINNPNP
jgi:hypothetical protein